MDFAQNRYFSARLGRFTSVDPLAASASAKNPQTLNRYTYALNSPYKFTDPLGLAATQHCWANICNTYDADEQAERGEQDERNINQSSTLVSNCGSPENPCRPASLRVESVEILAPCKGSVTKDCGTASDSPHGIKVGNTTIDTTINGEATQVIVGGRKGTIGPNLERNSKNTGKTNSDGQFLDAPFGISAPTPVFRATVKQEIYFRSDDEDVTVRTNKIIVTGKHDPKNKQYVYTITNGSDINTTVTLIRQKTYDQAISSDMVKMIL